MRVKVAQEIQWAVFASDAPLHSMKPEALPPTALFQGASDATTCRK